MPKKLDLTGQIFGRLTVLSRAPNIGKKTAWRCICLCGTEKTVQTVHLTRGLVHSCGCINHDNLVRRNTTHSLSSSRLYKIWANIRSRCSNPNAQSYEVYGGRGIQICDEWKDFEAFYRWAVAHGYHDDLTIDRIDNDAGYFPDNCRWITQKQQCRNKRNNHLLTFRGETLCISEWADRLGLTPGALLSRIRRGWSVDEALSTPSKIPTKK